MSIASIVTSVMILGILMFVLVEFIKIRTGNKIRKGMMSQQKFNRINIWCKRLDKAAWVVLGAAAFASFVMDVTSATKMPNLVGMCIGFIFGVSCLTLSYQARIQWLNKPTHDQHLEKYTNLHTWFLVTRAMGVILLLITLRSLLIMILLDGSWRAYF